MDQIQISGSRRTMSRALPRPTMTLDCHTTNAGATCFYQRLGYRTTGLVMRKPLEERNAQNEREPGHRAATVAGPDTASFMSQMAGMYYGC